MRWSATLLFLGSTLTLPGCVRLNASHCGNQGGAQMCQEQGKGDFCSICQASNDGCVDEAVDPVCDADELDDDPTQGSDSATSSDSSATSASETGASSDPTASTTHGDASGTETTDSAGSASAGGSGTQTGGPEPTSTGGATDGTDTDTDTASPTSTSSGSSTGTGGDCFPAGTPCTPLAGECCEGLSCLTLDVLNPKCG